MRPVLGTRGPAGTVAAAARREMANGLPLRVACAGAAPYPHSSDPGHDASREPRGSRYPHTV